MTSCCPPRPMQWNVVTGAIARGKSKSTGYARKRKSVRAWRWTCGVKPTPKAVNKPWQHCIVHGLDKPGVFTTDSILQEYYGWQSHRRPGPPGHGTSSPGTQRFGPAEIGPPRYHQ